MWVEAMNAFLDQVAGSSCIGSNLMSHCTADRNAQICIAKHSVQKFVTQVLDRKPEIKVIILKHLYLTEMPSINLQRGGPLKTFISHEKEGNK